MSFKLKSRWLNRTQEVAGAEASVAQSNQMETPCEVMELPVEKGNSASLPKFEDILENIYVSERYAENFYQIICDFIVNKIKPTRTVIISIFCHNEIPIRKGLLAEC